MNIGIDVKYVLLLSVTWRWLTACQCSLPYSNWPGAQFTYTMTTPFTSPLRTRQASMTYRGSALAPPLLAEVQVTPEMRGRCLGHPEACGQRLVTGQQVGIWGVWNPGFNLLKWALICLPRAVLGELKFFWIWDSLTYSCHNINHVGVYFILLWHICKKHLYYFLIRVVRTIKALDLDIDLFPRICTFLHFQ